MSPAVVSQQLNSYPSCVGIAKEYNQTDISAPSGTVVEATTVLSILSTTVTFTVSDGSTEKSHYQQ